MLTIAITSNYFAYDHVVTLTKGSIVVQTTSFFGYVRRCVYHAQVAEVSVQTEVLRYFGDGRSVVVSLDDGMEVPLTTMCTMEPAM